MVRQRFFPLAIAWHDKLVIDCDASNRCICYLDDHCTSEGEPSSVYATEWIIMYNDMSGWMMWGMGLLCLLVGVVLILGAAALIKYLLSDRKSGGGKIDGAE